MFCTFSFPDGKRHAASPVKRAFSRLWYARVRGKKVLHKHGKNSLWEMLTSDRRNVIILMLRGFSVL